MKKRNFPEEVYKGGRNLNAIWTNSNLTSNHKLFLAYITGKMNYESEFTEQRWESQTTIAKDLGVGISTVRKTIDQLLAGGYLIIRKRECLKTNQRLSNSVQLTDKLFSEFMKFKKLKQENKQVKSTVKNLSTPSVELKDPPPSEISTPPLDSTHPPPRRLRTNSFIRTPQENSLEINSFSLTINKPSNVPSVQNLSVSRSDDLFKKVRGKFPSKAPKEFIASEAHKHIARLFKDHLNTNARSTKHIPSDRDLEFQIALLLKQTHLRKPEMNELTLEAFVKFLHVLMDKNNHWQGWGVNFLSIPAALITKNGSSKLEKAWLSFGQIYEKQRELYEYAHERKGAGTPDCPY
jgi:DNA-binding MarR family transcriptional regulator